MSNKSKLSRIGGSQSSVETALEIFNSQQSVLHESTAFLERPSDLESALEEIGSHQSAVEKAMASVPRLPPIGSAIEEIVSRQSDMQNVMASVARPLGIGGAIEEIVSRQSAMQYAMTSAARPAGIGGALEEILSHQSAVEKAMAPFARPSVVENVREIFDAHRSSIAEAIASVSASKNLETALSNFGIASVAMIQEPDTFSSLFDAISSIDLRHEQIGDLDDRLVEASEEFKEVSDQKTFLNAFTELHPFIQAVFFYLLFHILLPQLNSISANILTPYVERYLEKSEASDRDKINAIKKLPNSVSGIRINEIRFITGNNVRLREEPSTKSDILDELALGQVVTVLSKKKNWIEVSYEYKNGESLSGWVFNRYTARFVK